MRSDKEDITAMRKELAAVVEQERVPVKERPILFSAPMVQAILEGSKTQTRRVVSDKFSKKVESFLGGDDSTLAFSYLTSDLFEEPNMPNGWYVYCADYPEELAFFLGQCPYGKVGDRLWVRETWAATRNTNTIDQWPERPHIIKEADGDEVYSAYIYRADGDWQWLDDDGWTTEKSYWKPSIHMPRIASRILLEITDIRVERLQDISDEDAIAEGVDIFKETDFNNYTYYLTPQPKKAKYVDASTTSPIKAFANLWESINGPDSWISNPWVWVVEFKVLEVKSNG